MARYRVAVDTGGTFSDFVYLNEETGKLSIAKLPSTPDDPSRAIFAGIEELFATAGETSHIGYFCHGTTVGTNALLEGKGAKTGLLVTEGFRGIYPVGEQARPYGTAIFDIMYDKPPPLVPRSLTGEVKERVDFRGDVLQPLDEATLRQTVRELAAQQVESIAVCLLFSFVHPEHEARVREIVREEMPDCSISLSCEVLPQIREYYRLSTTVINAYLQPIVARYIAELDQRLRGGGIATRQKYVMQSNGGMETFAAAARRAVTTVLSGPAGGVTAGVRAGRMHGLRNIITFDMGGTSCDVALIKNGEALLASRGKIAERDLAIPMLDINTVSAGGGTVARVDRFGTLQVGPQSAGAMPGPACYGRDGEMQEAIKAISTMRGHDLRDFMLLAFGGAGPLHAGRIARDLGMAGVVVPLYPGVFSALGLLMSDVKYDYVRSNMAPLSEVAPEEVNGTFERLAAQALTQLRSDGFAPEHIRIERSLDMRYAGQGYEIAVPCTAEPLRVSELKELRIGFDQQHQSMFGHMAPEEPVEIVSYRVRGVGLVPPVEPPKFARSSAALKDARRGTRRARFDGAEFDCPIYQREQLDVGSTFAGPAMLDQLDCTTVVRPGQAARVDEWKSLIVTQES